MQETRHPNKLRDLLNIAGLTQRAASEESGIAERTLRHYVNGDQIIPKKHRPLLAQVIGCNVQDLAPCYEDQRGISKIVRAATTMTYMKMDQHFAFGPIKTTAVVLDGTGEETYLPANIHTHYDPQPSVFFDEVLEAKETIRQEQEAKKANGQPYQWNGEKYHLSKIVVSRSPNREDMILGLWFKPRDHYTGLATRRCLDNPDFRDKYLSDEDWYTPVIGMSCSMGIDLIAVSSDGYALLTQRGMNQSVHQGMYHASVSEAVSPSFDRSINGPSPDLYRCAARGLAEELGLQESVDFSTEDIKFLSFTVDTHYALYGLRGIVKVSKSAEEILRNWHAGVKDKLENNRMFAVPFTPQEICTFVAACEPWAGGLVCLYHSLVHEFGRQKVDAALASM